MITQATIPGKEKRKRVRSPNYPAINLAEALNRARQLYELETQNWVNIEVASRHWGYNTVTSGGGLIVAALIAFGLMEDDGARDKRMVRITPQAQAIITDKRTESSERLQLVQKAVFNPKIYKELWDTYKGALPSDASLHHYLINEKGFNRKAVEKFTQDFRHTLAFAGMFKGGKISSISSEAKPKIRVGDFVCWESQGVVQFENRKVIRLSDDGSCAFVENSETGIPIEQLSVVVPSGDRGTPPMPKPQRSVKLGADMNEDVFTLEEGTIVLQWPSRMSKESFEDFEAWVELIKRKARRAIQENKKTAD